MRSYRLQKANWQPKTLSSLNQRTVALLEGQGYLCDVVESYNAFTKRKKDLFGIFDILAVGNGETVAVQITSKANMSARIKKIQESEFLPEIIRSGWRIKVIGWFKQKNGRYDCKEFEFWDILLIAEWNLFRNLAKAF